MSLGKLCSGSADSHHAHHDVIAGHHKGVGSISSFASRYPPQFVQAVLDLVPRFHEQEVLLFEHDNITETQWQMVHEVWAASIESTYEAEVMQALTKLHKNLGHPPNADLIRLLKHGQASDLAIKLARDFARSFCQSRIKPGSPLPANMDRVVEFNKRIGIDVKHLRSWRPNHKVKALNVVCQANGFQRVIPFFDAETSQLLRKLLDEHWIAWAGAPSEIILDAAQTNLAEPMMCTAEDKGCTVRPTAADAPWQLGKTENHGGWFNRILEKIIEQHSPRNLSE